LAIRAPVLQSQRSSAELDVYRGRYSDGQHGTGSIRISNDGWARHSAPCPAVRYAGQQYYVPVLVFLILVPTSGTSSADHDWFDTALRRHHAASGNRGH